MPEPLYFKNKILNIFLSVGIFSFLKLALNDLQIVVVASQMFNSNTKFNNMENDNLKTESNNANVLLVAVESFIDFEKQQRKTIRGNETMYDVKGHYKYLTQKELFDYHIERFYCA